MVNAKNIIVDKKLDDYDFNKDNYVIDQELTVTITLSEYRKLIDDKATHEKDISEIRSRSWDKDSKIDKLERENSNLSKQLNGYISRYGLAVQAEDLIESDED